MHYTIIANREGETWTVDVYDGNGDVIGSVEGPDIFDQLDTAAEYIQHNYSAAPWEDVES